MTPKTPLPAGGRSRTSSRSAIATRDAELATLAKALGHPARVAIVRLLAKSGECVCGDIVSQLPLAQATVSQHLKVLKQAGLIRGDIDPPRVCYCVNPEAIERFRKLAEEL
ncbi:MAG: winged helix-turn-helix transcriptional regulator [Candidatus Eisenbacteria bacterium]|uniref:Winged helix-turn-helix transcriptional regulator n=1 Tax=Eiseniibacteriota bacterium TaxID=2212470 RepID=A0A849SIR3_UNCEI|nr:winged helix-turn-helix transcriptional regulator [Candidatus Eisenbacteria bacterium]